MLEDTACLLIGISYEEIFEVLINMTRVPIETINEEEYIFSGIRGQAYNIDDIFYDDVYRKTAIAVRPLKLLLYR